MEIPYYVKANIRLKKPYAEQLAQDEELNIDIHYMNDIVERFREGPNLLKKMLMCGKVTQINLIDGFSRYSVKYKENRFYFSYKAAILCILRFISVRICGGSKHSHLSPKPKSIS